ncbi:MAG: hypothetical protein OEV85_03895 [Candidatus Thorarchaeota archaeon]|nr:hypothetical protein [Candidatus Thorarchaeota archaeon]
MRTLPHTGFIDESLDRDEALLMRARLHVRGSWNRFSEGMRKDAIAAMYDAISSAMQRFLFRNVSEKVLTLEKGENPSDDLTLFKSLERSGIFDESVSLDDFEYIAHTLDNALEDRLDSFDETRFVETSHILLVQLGVLPFNVCELPDTISP